VPKVPILFNKFNNALNHAGGAVKISAESAEQFDYEAELVIVIGKTARNVAEADAKSYILGYATGNDFTARDLQSRTSQWMVGKTLDGFGPGRALSRHRRLAAATTSRSSCGEWRGAAIIEHLGHGLRLRRAGQLYLGAT